MVSHCTEETEEGAKPKLLCEIVNLGLSHQS